MEILIEVNVHICMVCVFVLFMVTTPLPSDAVNNGNYVSTIISNTKLIIMNMVSL